VLQHVQADVDAPRPESRLAVAEVVLPEAAKGVVEAERGDLRPGVQEAAAPFDERRRVAGAEALLGAQASPTRARAARSAAGDGSMPPER
jgi:hypothetical protein